jgi:putative ABC transport system substrate-binding protein
VAGISPQAFKQEMRERGYVEGQGVRFEQRFGESQRERLAEAARELVRLKVDIIVTSTDEGVAAVKQQTQTIPIVMATSTDPVGTGFVVSLARPGRNITGNSTMSPELTGKRLELLKQLVPDLSRIAILLESGHPRSRPRLQGDGGRRPRFASAASICRGDPG